jgi:hypothetical protein
VTSGVSDTAREVDLNAIARKMIHTPRNTIVITLASTRTFLAQREDLASHQVMLIMKAHGVAIMIVVAVATPVVDMIMTIDATRMIMSLNTIIGVMENILISNIMFLKDTRRVSVSHSSIPKWDLHHQACLHSQVVTTKNLLQHLLTLVAL